MSEIDAIVDDRSGRHFEVTSGHDFFDRQSEGSSSSGFFAEQSQYFSWCYAAEWHQEAEGKAISRTIVDQIDPPWFLFNILRKLSSNEFCTSLDDARQSLRNLIDGGMIFLDEELLRKNFGVDRDTILKFVGHVDYDHKSWLEKHKNRFCLSCWIYLYDSLLGGLRRTAVPTNSLLPSNWKVEPMPKWKQGILLTNELFWIDLSYLTRTYMPDCSALLEAIQALEEPGQLDLSLARQLKEAIRSASIQLNSPNPFDLNCEGNAALASLSPPLAQPADDLNRVGDSATLQDGEPSNPSSTQRPKVSNKQVPSVEPTSKNVVVETVGELLSAFKEESLLPEGATLAIVAGEETRKFLMLANALVVAKGGEKHTALWQLIAEVQFAVECDEASVTEMTLETFVNFAKDQKLTPPRRRSEFNGHILEEIEKDTPPLLGSQSIEWIAARKENEEILGYPTTTLATYRLASSGGRQLTPYFGIDKDGRRWRRQLDKTEGSIVYYFAADVKKYRRKVSN